MQKEIGEHSYRGIDNIDSCKSICESSDPAIYDCDCVVYLPGSKACWLRKGCEISSCASNQGFITATGRIQRDWLLGDNSFNLKKEDVSSGTVVILIGIISIF